MSSNNENKKANMNKKKAGKVVNKRANALRIFSISSIVMFLAIILLLNILLTMTVEKKTEIDLSSESQNSISDISVDYINSLPADTKIRIVGLFDLTSPLELHLEFTVPLIENLAAVSGGRISVEYVNPDTDPSIVKQLDPNGLADLATGLYAVECNGKVRVFDPYNDCFIFDPVIKQQYGKDYPLSNIAENTIMSAIVNITSDSNYKVYYLTGLHEQSHNYLDSVFASMNIETAELYVNEPFVVPSDCSLLIINNPDIDISESVQEGLKAYINNGERPANIIVSLGITQNNINEKFEHINNVLNEVNLNVESNWVFDDNPDYVIDYDKSDFKGIITDDFYDLNSYGLVRYHHARSIVQTSRASSNIMSEPLFVSSGAGSIVKLDSYTQEYIDSENRSNVIVGAIGRLEGEYPSNVVVLGTEALTSDNYLLNVSTNDPNTQAIRKLVSKLVDSDVNLDIPYKSVSDYSLDISRIDANTQATVLVVFIVAIPIVMIVLAAIVYDRRSHL